MADRRMAIPAARTWIAIPLFLTLSSAGIYYMRLGPASQAAGKHFEALMEPGDYRWPESGALLRREYSGIPAIDMGLSFLVAAFYPGVRGAGMNGPFEQQQPYFLMSFGPILAAMSVEAGRDRNYLTVMSFTSIWSLFYQTVGGAVIIPLWFAFYLYTTSKAGYWQKPHTMSAASAQALFLAFWIGYVIPTVAIYLPGLEADTRQVLVGFWQPAPLYVNLLWFVLARTLPGAETERPKEEFSDPTYWIKCLHTSAVFTSTVFHWIMVYNCIFSKNPDITFINVLVPLTRDEWTMSKALLFIFQVDFWLIIASGLLWSYISVGDLFELGMTNIDAATGGLLMFFITTSLGPGAAISLTSIWREDRLRNAAMKSEKKTS